MRSIFLEIFKQSLKVALVITVPGLAQSIKGLPFSKFNRGTTKSSQGDYLGAIQDFDEAIRLKQNFAEAYCGRGQCKAACMEHMDAMQDYDDAIRLKPELETAYNNRGVSKAALGDHAGAIRDYSEAIRLHPTVALFYNNRALSYQILEESKKSQEDRQKARQYEGRYFNTSADKLNFAVCYYQNAILHYERGDYPGAVIFFTEGIRLEPYYEAYYLRGLCKVKLGNDNSAIEDFNVAIRLKPDFAEAYFERGYAKIELQNYIGAIKDFNETIRLMPDSAETYNARGNAYFRGGDYIQAREDFNQAIRLDPSFAVPYRNRGHCNAKFDDHKEAIKDFDEAIRLDSNYWITYYERALSKAAQGNHVTAIKDFDTVICLVPDNSVAYQGRADSYEAIGEDQKAQNDRHQATFIECKEEPKKRLYKAIEQGQRDLALVCLLTILEEKSSGQPPVTLTPGGLEPVLFTLARFGQHSWLPQFLEQLSPDVTDEQGNTVMHVAAQYGHTEFCNALIGEKILKGRAGGGYHWPKNFAGETPLHTAALNGHVQLLIRFKEIYNAEEDLKEQTTDGSTVIHLLVRHGMINPLETLLTRFRFLSLRIQDNNGFDPLMLAVFEKRVSIVHSLLKYRVDLANHDRHGRTALHLAVLSDNEELVKALMIKGAALDVKDDAGKLPKDYAVDHSPIAIYFNRLEREKRPSQHFEKTSRQWHNLVFEGGGAKGLAYPASLRALLEFKVISTEHIRRVGGTSAGAITALLVGLRYSLDEIDHLMGVKRIPGSTLPQVKFAEMLDGPFGEKILAAKNRNWELLLGGRQHQETLQKLRKIDNVLIGLARLMDGTVGRGLSAISEMGAEFRRVYRQLEKNLGLCPGKKLYDLFDQLIRKKLSEKAGYPITTPVTFAELAEYQDFCKLYFVGVNTSTGKAEYFSHEHTPNMVVANAVRISMSIPGVFMPVPKVTKDEQGRCLEGTEFYVDGGASINYPIKLFDFARYGDDKHLFGSHPQINQSTLGLRLVGSKRKVPSGDAILGRETASKEESVPMLWQHILDLLHTFYNREESDHDLNGDGFRTIYIDTLDINGLDFERVDEEATKMMLSIRGKKGAEDFINRMRGNPHTDYSVKLPDTLEKAIQKHSYQSRRQVIHGQHQVVSEIDPKCPRLVVAFYEYDDERIRNYLHESLHISSWVRDEKDMTPYHIAAMTNNVKALRNLLQADPDGAAATNRLGQTPRDITQSKEILALLDHYPVIPEKAGKEKQPALQPILPFPAFSSNYLPEGTELKVPGDGSCLFWSVAIGVLATVLDNKEKYRLAFKNLFVLDAKDDKDLFDRYSDGLKNRIQAFLSSNDMTLIVKQGKDDPFYHLINWYFRQKVANYIHSHSSEFSDFIGDSAAVIKHVTSLRQESYWGGNIEIQAIFRLLGKNYRLVVENSTIDDLGSTEKPVVRIIHTNFGGGKGGEKNHYNLRIPKIALGVSSHFSSSGRISSFSSLSSSSSSPMSSSYSPRFIPPPSPALSSWGSTQTDTEIIEEKQLKKSSNISITSIAQEPFASLFLWENDSSKEEAWKKQLVTPLSSSSSSSQSSYSPTLMGSITTSTNRTKGIVSQKLCDSVILAKV